MISAIALDLGSTAIKAGVLDQQGRLGGIVTQPVPPVLAEGGHYESDALAYAETADRVLASCLAQSGRRPADMPFALCSQRSSFLIWEKFGGTPVTPLISWQDNRGAASCVALQAQELTITELSGLRLTPYYFAAKLRVLLQENPQWRERLLSGEWLVGTLDSFLIWRWTGGRHYLTDVSMAARTLLMDIRQRQWSTVLCELFNIPQQILPEIRPSTGLNIPLDNGLKLMASLADQSAALLASVGEETDVALVNLGTGGFVIRNMDEPRQKADGYLQTLVYQYGALRPHIAIEGTINSIAAALAAYPLAECKPEALGEIKDIFCLAEPSGLGAPYFRNDLGLLFSTQVGHLAQAQISCLLQEAIVFRVARIVEDFHGVAEIRRVYLSGGLSALPSLQQGIAQCLPCPVFLLQQHDASLQGAAMLAVGMTQASHSEAAEIQLLAVNHALTDKYIKWKQWLDAALVA